MSNSLCTAEHSFWDITSCTDDSACSGLNPAGRCVDLDGTGPGTAGGCAEDASDGCTYRTEVTAVAIGGGTVQVCGTPYLCDSTTNKCERQPCSDNTDCSGLFNKCNTANGRCVMCFGDNDCAGGPSTKCMATGFCGCANDSECTRSFSKCAATGLCGCANNSECTDSLFGNVCNITSTICGCTDVQSCTRSQFDGTTGECFEY